MGIFAAACWPTTFRDWRACWWAWSGSARSEPRSRSPSIAWVAASLSTIRRPATLHGRRRWARSMPLQELLAAADVVTLHVPLIAATRGMIGDAELAAMKPGAVLIQAARGGIVDEASLADSLTAGHLGGAAVDVYSTEPPAPDNPLLRLTGEPTSRLLLTPHIAGVTRQSSAFLFRSAWQNVERVMRGEPPLHRAY